MKRCCTSGVEHLRSRPLRRFFGPGRSVVLASACILVLLALQGCARPVKSPAGITLTLIDQSWAEKESQARPNEQPRQILEAFFTTKEQGAGIGLAISRSIVQSYGGRLWARNSPGRTATFHFTLPTEREAQP